jgi:hypothetical protein
MNAVTIDNFDIKVHERYAYDQEYLDPIFLNESSSIPQHSEINGTSSIYASKWEELFEIQLKNVPWACFLPPPKYTAQARRFFRYRIVPSLSFTDTEDEEDDENKEHPLLEQILNFKSPKTAYHSVENEKTVLLDLLTSIKDLNRWLIHVNSRKIQYQKG